MHALGYPEKTVRYSIIQLSAKQLPTTMLIQPTVESDYHDNRFSIVFPMIVLIAGLVLFNQLQLDHESLCCSLFLRLLEHHELGVLRKVDRVAKAWNLNELTILNRCSLAGLPAAWIGR